MRDRPLPQLLLFPLIPKSPERSFRPAEAEKRVTEVALGSVLNSVGVQRIHHGKAPLVVVIGEPSAFAFEVGLEGWA